jgi:serine/threonine protein phosphatase PrpC
MQDNFTCVPGSNINGKPLGCFAVFDGHGNHGDVVSQYCADHFVGSLMGRKALRNSGGLSSAALSAALKKTFLKFDLQLKEVVQNQKSREQKVDFVFSGTTATVVAVLQTSFVIGNTGDSRTLLCRSGSLQFATKDHNPGDKVEDDRIVAAGGKIHTTPSRHKVILDTEAYTNLAVSRTLGDFGFKCTPKIPAENQIVSPLPDITVLERDHRTDEFLLLASDGIFKSLTNSDVVEFVSRQLTVTEDLAKICHNLVEMAYYSVS